MSEFFLVHIKHFSLDLIPPKSEITIFGPYSSFNFKVENNIYLRDL